MHGADPVHAAASRFDGVVQDAAAPRTEGDAEAVRAVFSRPQVLIDGLLDQNPRKGEGAAACDLEHHVRPLSGKKPDPLSKAACPERLHRMARGVTKAQIEAKQDVCCQRNNPTLEK